jgi:hypothetical protein
MFMTSIFDVINTINLDVYDVDIRRHKHDQLRCLWRRYSSETFERDNLSCCVTLSRATFSALNKRYKCLVLNLQRDKTNVSFCLAKSTLR